MSGKIRIGIYGYGNIGKSVEKAVAENEDMEVAAIFTRRDPSKVRTQGAKAVAADKVLEYKDKIDVMILCGGSATDLPEQGPEAAKHFNIVDSYDTHAKIPEYMKKMDANAKQSKKAAVIAAGWDPGLFSMMKALFAYTMPNGANNAFWGPGVSQGHSDAIRRVEGVADAIQYTVPSESVLDEVRKGSDKEYSTRQRHKRVCYVVPKEGADKKKIEAAIKAMPYYFSDYDTEVSFITADELKRDHSTMPHGGYVFRNGPNASGERYVMEFHIEFGSNPAFTASVMAAYARAAFRLFKEKDHGAKTVLDIPVSYLSAKSREEQTAEFL